MAKSGTVAKTGTVEEGKTGAEAETGNWGGVYSLERSLPIKEL